MARNDVEYRADLDELRAKRGKTHIDLDPAIIHVRVDDAMVWYELDDGRVIGHPLSWSPRLQAATAEQRNRWVLWPMRRAVHWPEVDEDISVRVLMGHPS